MELGMLMTSRLNECDLQKRDDHVGHDGELMTSLKQAVCQNQESKVHLLNGILKLKGLRLPWLLLNNRA
jgi:hypothetical protein